MQEQASPLMSSFLIFILGPHLAAGAWSSTPGVWGAGSVWVPAQLRLGLQTSTPSPPDPVINPLFCFFIQQFRLSQCDKLL